MTNSDGCGGGGGGGASEARTSRLKPSTSLSKTFNARCDTLDLGNAICGMSKKMAGTSLLNPEGMTKNCVSVSLAKILEFPNVDEMWLALLHRKLDDRGLSEQQLVGLINASKWKFQKRCYIPMSGKTAYRIMLNDLWLSSSQGMPTGQIAIYKQQDGTHHCVVVDQLCGFEAVCYQHNSDGLDVTDEFAASEIIKVYSLTCPFESREFLEWRDRLIWNKSLRWAQGHGPGARGRRIWASLSQDDRDGRFGEDIRPVVAQLQQMEEALEEYYHGLRRCIPTPFFEIQVEDAA